MPVLFTDFTVLEQIKQLLVSIRQYAQKMLANFVYIAEIKQYYCSICFFDQVNDIIT